MLCDFFQFCHCGTAGYQALAAQIAACAALGRSYEFPFCRMPPGCAPAVAALGFWGQSGGYLLYLRPAVRYEGADRRLACFFSRDRWYFPDLPSLARALEGLAPPQIRPAPAGRTVTLVLGAS